MLASSTRELQPDNTSGCFEGPDGEQVSSEDGPLSVRVRPSSPKRDCTRRATNTGGKLSVNVHAKSRSTLETTADTAVRNEGQAGACPDRTRAIPCNVQLARGVYAG